MMPVINTFNLAVALSFPLQCYWSLIMKKLIYTFGLMLCTIGLLYAKPIKLLLREIKEEVVNLINPKNNNSKGLLQEAVHAVWKHNKNHCPVNFFCQAEKSLEKLNNTQLGRLCALLDTYNNQTGQICTFKNSTREISVHGLLIGIKNCTVERLKNSSVI